MRFDTSLPPNETNTPPSETLAIDRENAFMLYAVFCGDAVRTAHALGAEEETIKNLAIEYGWDKKLKPIIDLSKSSRAGDVERAVNRALNFVDAHRYRAFLARVIKELTGMSYTDLKAFLFPEDGDVTESGRRVVKKFSTRSLADLASAMEKCQTMTYHALNDTATERKERKEDGGDNEATASEMHLRLAEAMATAGQGSNSIRGLVLDAQLQLARENATVPFKPEPLKTEGPGSDSGAV